MGGLSAFERLHLIVAALLPLSIGLAGFYVSRSFRLLHQEQWQSREIVSRRLQFFEDVASDLNALLCFYAWLGDWKDLSPPQIIAARQRLEKQFHTNRYLIGEEVFARYRDFIGPLFSVIDRPGQNIVIRASLNSEKGDRTIHSRHRWEEAWRACFDEEQAAAAPRCRRPMPRSC